MRIGGMVAGVTQLQAETPTTIAGFPLVRLLARTDRRERWVVQSADGVGAEVHRSLPGEDASLAREAEALLRADHAHVVPILDVAYDDGVVLVRPLLPHHLADWLLVRVEPAPGEVVTALAPIAAAIGALHRLGASAGGCSAHDVRLDDDGAPMLLGEGARIETERPTPAWLAASEGVGADVEGWRALALTLADACGRALPDAVERAIEARDLTVASAALLAAWPALPLALDGAPRIAPRTSTRRHARERAHGLEAVWSRVALLLERLPETRVRALPALARHAVATVRPRYWAFAAAGIAALLLAIGVTVLPSQSGAVVAEPLVTGSAAHDPAGAHPATTHPAPTDPGPADLAPTDPAPADPTPTDPAPAAAAPTDPAPTNAAPGDPLAVAEALLLEREACLDAADAACLVALHEPTSPLLDADEPWRMPDDGELEPVQRLGDAWLLRVRSETDPASVLLTSTEAGWTLRDAWPG